MDIAAWVTSDSFSSVMVAVKRTPMIPCCFHLFLLFCCERPPLAEMTYYALKMVITAVSPVCLPSREERHGAPTGASGPVRPAAHLRRHATHPEPRGAARHWGDPGRRGQAGPLVRDRGGQESGGQPNAAGLGLQPPPWSVIVEGGGRVHTDENQRGNRQECLSGRAESDKLGLGLTVDQTHSDSSCHFVTWFKLGPVGRSRFPMTLCPPIFCCLVCTHYYSFETPPSSVMLQGQHSV